MNGGLIALAVVAGQLALWVMTARLHYRHLKWGCDLDYTESDRRWCAGAFGFFWPVTLTGVAFNGLFKFIGWATAYPSVAESREARRRKNRERLADLDAKIKAAEAELRKAEAELNQALNGGSP